MLHIYQNKETEDRVQIETGDNDSIEMAVICQTGIAGIEIPKEDIREFIGTLLHVQAQILKR